MAQYDIETLYLAELNCSGVLLQVACDALAEVVSLTGDASLLEPFFASVLTHDFSDTVEAKGKLAAPVRKKLAAALLRQRLPEIIATMRAYAQKAEQLKRATVPN